MLLLPLLLRSSWHGRRAQQAARCRRRGLAVVHHASFSPLQRGMDEEVPPRPGSAASRSRATGRTPPRETWPLCSRTQRRPPRSPHSHSPESVFLIEEEKRVKVSLRRKAWPRLLPPPPRRGISRQALVAADVSRRGCATRPRARLPLLAGLARWRGQRALRGGGVGHITSAPCQERAPAA